MGACKAISDNISPLKTNISAFVGTGEFNNQQSLKEELRPYYQNENCKS